MQSHRWQRRNTEISEKIEAFLNPCLKNLRVVTCGIEPASLVRRRKYSKDILKIRKLVFQKAKLCSVQVATYKVKLSNTSIALLSPDHGIEFRQHCIMIFDCDFGDL